MSKRKRRLCPMKYQWDFCGQNHGLDKHLYQYHVQKSFLFFVYSTPPKQLEYLFTECFSIFQTEYENLEWDSGHSEVKRMFSINCTEARISQHGDSGLLYRFTMPVSHQQNLKLKPNWHNFLLNMHQKVLDRQITISANTNLCV